MIAHAISRTKAGTVVRFQAYLPTSKLVLMSSDRRTMRLSQVAFWKDLGSICNTASMFLLRNVALQVSLASI